MAGRDYARGFDSGFATDADYEDGFVASDARIAEMAARNGMSHEAAKRALGVSQSPMDRLRAMTPEDDAGGRFEGPEY